MQTYRINISLFLLIFSVSSLSAAYISQYEFGLFPCMLCLYQRIPFFFVAIVSALSLFIKGKLKLILVSLCGLALLVGAGIAFYHVGVEQGKFELSSGCDLNDAIPSTIEEMTQQLLGKPHVSCDKPQFVFMGISMAGYNFLFSAMVGFTTLLMVYRFWRDSRYIGKSNAYKKDSE